MQCNVEFGYQLSICSRTEENHGKPYSSLPVAGPSGCKMTSSQQPGAKHANPNISPCLCCYFIWKKKCTYLFLQIFLQLCTVWILRKNTCLYAYTYIKTYIYFRTLKRVKQFNPYLTGNITSPLQSPTG
jgi:hypothetical protein